MTRGALSLEATSPRRIQRRRTKGWRLPPNTVCVSRPSKWGNPYLVDEDHTPAMVVRGYRVWVAYEVTMNRLDLAELRGKDLACWCPFVDEDGNRVPCHADILLEIANL